MRDRLRLAGRVVKAVGLNGDIKVYPLMLNFEDLVSQESLYVGNDDKEVQDITMTLVSRSGKLLRYRIAGHRTREDAKDLVGQYIFVPLPPGELLPEEILGFEVVSVEGRLIGKLVDVLPMPAHDVLVVSSNERELLIPDVPEIVTRIDAEKKVVTIFPMEGLLDQ